MFYVIVALQPLILMLENVPIIGDLLNWLESAISVDGWIDSGYQFISERSFFEKFFGLIIFAIIVLLGIFSLIKKLSKLIIVIAIIIGLWLLYTNMS